VHVVVQFTTAAAYVQSEVLGALRRALGSGPDGMFAEQRCPIAQPLRLGDLYEAVFSVAGVSSAQVLWLSTAKPPASPAGPVPDSLDPGSDGVVRCDSDSADPDGVRGTVTLSPRGGAA
jgi:hypothetical protein